MSSTNSDTNEYTYDELMEQYIKSVQIIENLKSAVAQLKAAGDEMVYAAQDLVDILPGDMSSWGIDTSNWTFASLINCIHKWEKITKPARKQE